MPESRDLEKELRFLREEVMHCFSQTLPAKEFAAAMVLALTWLHVILKRRERTRDLNERRCLNDEFDHGKRAVEKGLRALKRSSRREPAHSGQKFREVVS